MVVNPVPSFPYSQNLPDSRPFSSLITNNWDNLQFFVIGDENGLKSRTFWLQETEGTEFVVIEIVF
jgi:hypothetical protein